MLNFIIDDVLRAIAAERPELEGWAEDKAHELADNGKLEALRWVAFDLDAQNLKIACKTLGIEERDIEPLRRVLRVI